MKNVKRLRYFCWKSVFVAIAQKVLQKNLLYFRYFIQMIHMKKKCNNFDWVLKAFYIFMFKMVRIYYYN